ncbi:MAG: hypothetical protein FP824_10965 [Euryarchaeota archaeon]|nr:hypothetical protein [Euryarchaeota archaeon]
MDIEVHTVQESSSFFQGHPDQFFTRYSMSFQVSFLNEDFSTGHNMNFERFRRYFYGIITRNLSMRANLEGYDYTQFGQNDFKIAIPRLLDNKDDGVSGRFRIYPNAALCSGCHAYFKLDEIKPCNCDARIEHFTFVAFCDECGATYPIEAMSNLRHDCNKCGQKKGLSKINWKYKDQIGTYNVQCSKCDNSVSLYLRLCDHLARPSKKVRSNKAPSSFRGVPARGGAIYHPLVITIPDIPMPDEIGNNGMRNVSVIELHTAFNDFFGDIEKVNDTYLHLPEYREKLLANDEFWKVLRVQVICEDLEFDVENKNLLLNYDIFKITKTVILNAKNSVNIKLDGTSNKDEIYKKYGLEEIKKVLESLNQIELDEEDLQALFLISEESREQVNTGEFATRKRSQPRSPPSDWHILLDEFNLDGIIHIENLNMVQALLGIIDGSTKRMPQLFRVIESGSRGKKIPTVYVRDFKTEGLIFKFSIEKIVDWLQANNIITTDQWSEKHNTDSDFRQLLTNNDIAFKSVQTLLHTISHLLIQRSSMDTGLDIRSLSENIYPKAGTILLFSTNEVNIGGLEYTFDFHMSDWLSRVKELAEDCPQDPGCLEDEDGACNACSFLPEFVCRYFNQNLDRECLIGGSRYGKGFFQ